MSEYSRSADGQIFINHMANWPRWVADNPDDTSAQMLGLAVEEIHRLRKLGYKEHIWAGCLLYAYVMTCEKLCCFCQKKIVPISNDTSSIGWALRYIEILNRWRKERRFGGLEP